MATTTGTMGQALSAPFNQRGNDRYQVHADSGGILTLAFEHPEGAGTQGEDIALDVYDSAGRLLASRVASGNATYTTVLAGAGDVDIVVRDANIYDQHVPNGVYRVTPTLQARPNTGYEAEANDTAATATAARLGQPITGTLEVRDIDYLRIHAPQAGVLALAFVHPGGAGHESDTLSVEAFDGAGNVLAARDLNGNAELLAPVPAAGDYYLRVQRTWSSSGNLDGLYSVTPTLASQPGATYDGGANNSSVTALPAPLGAPIIGTLLDGRIDTDTFRLHADGPGALTLTFAHPAGAGTAGHGATVALYDASGAEVCSRTVSGSTVIRTTVPQAGDYYLKLTGNYYIEQALYQLTPTLAPAQAHTHYDGAVNNTSASAVTGAAGDQFAGALNGLDSDMFRFHTTGGASLALNFLHPDGAGADGAGITITLFDAAGAMLSTRTAKGNLYFTQPLPGAGDYYVKIGNASYRDIDSGVYAFVPATGTAVAGSAADDRILAGAGSDIIQGGAGRDTVVYAQAVGAYRVSATPGGVVVEDVVGGGGLDTLFNVERVLFAGSALAFDASGGAGQIYRLYQAAFDRMPDAGGLGYWIAQRDKGATLDAIAAGFAASAEFHAMMGAAPSGAEVAARLYQHVLHRAPDAAGLAYWSAVLGSQPGTALTGAVLASFSESPENQAQLAVLTGQGMPYIPYG
ncbi:MAG: DUF4214 domain-containing protein [Burkholderiaceae bacterium]|nr:DUF4214 domain-containing protein [Burkholderiaceae bacterium]